LTYFTSRTRLIGHVALVEEMYSYKTLVVTPQERKLIRTLWPVTGIILKWILENYGVIVYTGLIDSG
jgi:hypothetical protein